MMNRKRIESLMEDALRCITEDGTAPYDVDLHIEYLRTELERELNAGEMPISDVQKVAYNGVIEMIPAAMDMLIERVTGKECSIEDVSYKDAVTIIKRLSIALRIITEGRAFMYAD